MIERGILPKGTQLTPKNPCPEGVADPLDHVRPWDSLSANEKKLFPRLMEVFAAYAEYTDAQIGRLVDYLEKTGQYENTLIIYAADNGTSGAGSPNGSVNDKVVASGSMKTQPAKFTLSGDGMCIGWDSGDAVSEPYKTPGRFTGGTILVVAVDTGDDVYENLELEAKRLLLSY
jgi:arylsulfatase A-like enzyme